MVPLGNAWLFNNAHVYGEAHVCGDARVGDHTVIARNLDHTPACPAVMR